MSPYFTGFLQHCRALLHERTQAGVDIWKKSDKRGGGKNGKTEWQADVTEGGVTSISDHAGWTLRRGIEDGRSFCTGSNEAVGQEVELFGEAAAYRFLALSSLQN